MTFDTKRWPTLQVVLRFCILLLSTNQLHAANNDIVVAKQKAKTLEATIQDSLRHSRTFKSQIQERLETLKIFDRALVDMDEIMKQVKAKQKKSNDWTAINNEKKKARADIKKNGLLYKFRPKNGWEDFSKIKPDILAPSPTQKLETLCRYVQPKVKAQIDELTKQLNNIEKRIMQTNQELIATNNSIVNMAGDVALAEKYHALDEEAKKQLQAYRKNAPNDASAIRKELLELEREKQSAANAATTRMKEILSQLERLKINESMSLETRSQIKRDRARLIAELQWLRDQHLTFGFTATNRDINGKKRHFLHEKLRKRCAERLESEIRAEQNRRDIFLKREPYIRLAIQALENLNVKFDGDPEELLTQLKQRANSRSFTVNGSPQGELKADILKGLRAFLANTTANEMLDWLAKSDKSSLPAMSPGNAKSLGRALKMTGFLKQFADASLDGMLVLYKGLQIRQDQLTPGKSSYNSNQLKEWLKDKYGQEAKLRRITADELGKRVMYEMEAIQGIKVKDSLLLDGTKGYWGTIRRPQK